jgi:uncharacterized protein YgbK (DUF1537 family)
MKQAASPLSEWQENQVDDALVLPLLEEIRKICRESKIKIVVVDDDPTGSQTIYDLPVITSWEKELVEELMQADCPGFFILTNSRSMPEIMAVATNREIARVTSAVVEHAGFSLMLISRGDSTLRGHFYPELQALNSGLGMKADGFVFMPYFKEGNRITLHGVHYVWQNDQFVPAASTNFARDPVFPYSSSDLKNYIAEKTQGRVSAGTVLEIGVSALNSGPDAVGHLLDLLGPGQFAVADGACFYHAAVMGLSIIRQQQKKKQLVVRCAPSLVQAVFGISGKKEISADQILFSGLPNEAGGLIVVGSFIAQTGRQINHLLKHTGVKPFELVVSRLSGPLSGEYLEKLASEIEKHLRNKTSIVLYTSRDIVYPQDEALHRQTADRISDALVKIIQKLPIMPRFIVAKGGITSSDIATLALGIRKARVLGQLLPGVQVWRIEQGARFTKMPFIIVPGNIGSDDYLSRVYYKLNEHETS